MIKLITSIFLRRCIQAAVALLATALPHAVHSAEPLLGPGDTVRVIVFENPDLTTEGRISVQGTLGFPLLGEVAIGNKTTRDAALVISDGLKKSRYLKDPHVNISIVEARSQRVMVLGHVVRPGQYALDGTNERLSDMLALAGGRSESGSDRVIITRKNGGERLEVDVAEMYRRGDLSGDVSLQNGDTVFVPSAPVFYVYGAVQRAGSYRLEPATSVRAALSVGGGLTPRGSERGIKIHRRMPDGSVRELTARLTDPIQANDVIYVRESLF